MALLETPPPLAVKKVSLPQRFQTSRLTLFMDQFMNYFIKAGGIGVITAVCGIFVFILSQTMPLLTGASVKPVRSVELNPKEYVDLGVDEWGELPFLMDKEGTLFFVDLNGTTGITAINPMPSDAMRKITAFRYMPKRQELVYGTSSGQVFIANVRFSPRYDNEGQRRIESEIVAGELIDLGAGPYPISQVAYGDSGSQKLAAAVVDKEGGSEVWAVRLIQEETLSGVGELLIDRSFDVTNEISGTPQKILVNAQADNLIVTTQEGQVFVFRLAGEELKLVQTFLPFKDLPSPAIASADYVFGDVSLVLTHSEGFNRIYSLYVPENKTGREFGLTKNFPILPGGAEFYDASLRNKAFLIGREGFVSLRFSTTETVRWESYFPFKIKTARIGGKYDKLFFLDSENKFHIYELHDPHPEAGIKAFFGKLWYEGYTHPSFEWQSTGGTDDFEPKLSLIPLIIGTLKGTFFAMLFALPIALLAGIYTSQFAHPNFKLLVKPIMEIMASLPSVVLGFLAALWLAPLIEDKVPSLMVILVLLPLFSLGFGWCWSSLPLKYRKYIKPGSEWLVMIPIILMAGYLGWALGPYFEKLFFVVTDPDTGKKISDFRLWWPQITGTSFEQRKSLVVGFMMGFAVIPIIFTIAEDSFSNVPKALASASLALGASRWQTALHVILPTAFPGVFSALMIGLGRAVGETMIVVMATGNTPIMDFNIFSGMRTLSANIAVELPEAPYLGTLYRTLFLGALALFIMTFFVNTAAEIIRQHFREKYKTV